MKISSKKELQQIVFNIDFKDFMIVYKKCATKPHSFLVINMNILKVKKYCLLIKEK